MYVNIFFIVSFAQEYLDSISLSDFYNNNFLASNYNIYEEQVLINNNLYYDGINYQKL